MTSTNAIDLPPELSEKLDEMAAGMNVSRASIVHEALTTWLERETRRHQLTLDAIASVDAGHFVDHEEALRWMASLGTDAPLPLPKP